MAAAFAVLTAVALTRARAAAAANDIALPPYRYLFLIDTSAAMSRQKEKASDTIHRLILSGIDGRIRTGDTLGIWTVREEIYTNAFPARMWVPAEKQELATRAYRFLRDQKFTKKARLDGLWTAIEDAARASGALTVFLLSDGTSQLTGTPFDAPVNEIFKKHAAGMRKAKKPFVIVFVAQEGRVVAHAVSPGGGPIHIPRVRPPPTGEPTAAQTKPGAQPRPSSLEQPAVQAAKTNVPSKPSIEELMAELARQTALRRSNAVTTATAAPATPPDSTKPSIPASASTPPPPTVETPDAGTADSRVAVSTQEAGEISLNLPSRPVEQPSESAQAETAGRVDPSEGVPAFSTGAPPGVSPESALEPPTPSSGDRLAPKPGEPDEESALSAAPLERAAAVAVAAHAGSSPQTYLLIGSLLLAVTVALGWLIFRHAHPAPKPSLISRSMDNKEG